MPLWNRRLQRFTKAPAISQNGYRLPHICSPDSLWNTTTLLKLLISSLGLLCLWQCLSWLLFLFFVHHETHSEHVWCLLSFFIVYTIIVLSFFKFFCNTIVKYWFAQISKLKDCKMENISWKILILLRITCWSSFWCLKTMLDTEYTISLYVHCWQDLLCQNHEEKRHRVLRRMSSCSVEGFFLFCWRLVVPKAVPVIEDVHLLYFLCVPGQQSDVSDKIDDRYST